MSMIDHTWIRLSDDLSIRLNFSMKTSMNPLDSDKPIGPFFYNMNTDQWQKIWKMAKINNFDEANDESLTVEEKLCCSKTFVQI